MAPGVWLGIRKTKPLQARNDKYKVFCMLWKSQPLHDHPVDKLQPLQATVYERFKDKAFYCRLRKFQRQVFCRAQERKPLEADPVVYCDVYMYIYILSYGLRRLMTNACAPQRFLILVTHECCSLGFASASLPASSIKETLEVLPPPLQTRTAG